MLKYQMIIFDFDGTLADSKEDVWQSVEYACSFYNCSIPAAFRGDPSNLAFSTGELFDIFCPDIPKEKKQEFIENVKIHYRTINDFHNTVLFPRIEYLLAELVRRGSKCSIASNKPFQPLDKILREKGWGKYFEKYISPDYYPDRVLSKEKMIEILLMENKDNLKPVYIGDTYTDIVASRANRIDSIGVLYGDGDPGLVMAEKPDYIVETSHELVDLLLNLQKG